MPSISASNKSDIEAFQTEESDGFAPSKLKVYINKDVKSKNIEASIENKRQQESEEEARLLYVAMTRSRDFLVLCLHEKVTAKKKENNERPTGGVAMLRYALDQSEIIESLSPIGKNAKLNKSSRLMSQDCESQVITLEVITRFKNSICDNASQSPSSLDQFEHSDKKSNESKRFIHITQPGQANLIGNAVHRVLNLIAFDAESTQIDLVSQKCSKREGIEQDWPQVAALVSNALSYDLLRKSTNSLREVPVSGLISGKLVEGYIDLLLETDAGWLIVDYKTDSIGGKELFEAKLSRYSTQLKTYAFLLSKTHNLKVCGVALLFLKRKKDGLRFIEGFST